MKVTKDIDTFSELWENSWSGAKDTLKEIQANDKEEELMDLIEDIFSNQEPTETDVNDFLWIDRDFIYEQLEIGDEKE